MSVERAAETDEAEVLLAEMRHRLANCFQLITGLVRLRLRRVKGKEAREHLTWLLDAITTLGLLQQRLAAPNEASFQAYLREAAAFWDRLAAEQGVAVALAAHDGVAVPDEAAPTLALIAHELVTNCLEHAFPEGRAGRVTLMLRSVADGAGPEAELTVADDGCGPGHAIGFGEGVAGSLGLGLVRSLASRLGGSFAITRGEPAGTVARVRFPMSGGLIGAEPDRETRTEPLNPDA